MKNFLLQKVFGKKAPWLLLSLHASTADDVEFRPFTKYVEWMRFTKGYSANTIEQYVGHVARFIDFTIEVSRLDECDGEVSTLIHWYQDYLMNAGDSDIEVVQKLCQILDKQEKTSITSIAYGIEAAIAGFLTFQIDQSELNGSDNVFSEFVVKGFVRTERENKAIKSKDWLASTIRGSLNRSFINRDKMRIFSVTRRARFSDKRSVSADKEYPLEKIVALLSQSPNRKKSAFHRDMALYALLAASGCRTHEALQIRSSDIDFENKRIFLRDPFQRENKDLIPKELEGLAWKGRACEEVFMIAPFEQYFWLHLNKYLQLNFQSSVNHNFIFQKRDGRPLFTASRSDRNKTFKKYAMLSGCDALKVGLHSLRHSYGRYVLNYLPVGEGQYGLPPAYVQKLMGHASPSSTDVYAIRDTALLDMYIEYANHHIRSEKVSLKEIKIRYIEAQENELNAIKKELLSHD